ncbi:hypothetical protein JKP88DRAFT_208476 [Tribonema minus]|uniref:GPN-loop GTPase n=1 Tax=Tribonema minus TaxID=303371 RepID=A0A835YZW9_9STRA|nr:hypothetical protein JKP88DRAFT_208476 [Tribonema minus]
MSGFAAEGGEVEATGGDEADHAGVAGEAAAAAGEGAARRKPVVCIVLGMAGSGKTTLLQRINLQMNSSDKQGYYINLDPAVTQVPFGANIDIRDTVNYKEVMAQYGLGPNGGIMTSLNLFATRFDQVIGLMEARSDSAEGLDYVFVDTPGQIEVFTWSASGQIITESLASAFPTCLIYVIDTPRTTSPTTFMSNMLYACSILYRTRLPMVLAFNKSDVTSPDFAAEWMSDFEKFQEALDETADESYMGSLNRSLSLVLDEFYSTLKHVGVSAATGEGIDQLFQSLDAAGDEFIRDYLPDLQARMAAVAARTQAAKEREMTKLMADVAVTRGDKPLREGGEGDAMDSSNSG